jgi:NAD-dependent dihydropyrimidine dehydrogenase PreA subunit
MPVIVDVETCDACLKCADVCPNQSIEKGTTNGKEHAKIKDDQCIDCYICVAECPTGAIAQP